MSHSFFHGEHGRRDFLKRVGLGAAGLLLGSRAVSWAAENAVAEPGTVARRKLGRHDIELSILGIGGHSLGSVWSEDEARRIVDEAIDAGVNFFDNCWEYLDGRAEERMGRLLQGRRDKAFLMTKVCAHDHGSADGMMEMLEQSLRRLKTDYLDLWQLHAISKQHHVEHAYDGGGLEVMERARKQGKIRFIGFTGHTSADLHLAMIERGFAFDACQLPLSPIDGTQEAFQRRVLPELVKRQIAPLAMKTLGGNARAIRDRLLTVEESLRYTWSLPITLVVAGITSLSYFRHDLQIARAFAPMQPQEMLALEERCRPQKENLNYQPYRRWTDYRDGDAHRYA
jgi:predicted aldo/keto reductase-like oxidoreductase